MKRVLVIGSLNMDYSVDVVRFPEAGETISGERMHVSPGGKGANQAYTLGSLDANVTMIGAVGNDEDGERLVENLRNVKVNTDAIKVVNSESTGRAIITVNADGENRIIILHGANYSLTTKDIDENEDLIKKSDIIVLQLEIPIEVVEYAIKLSNKYQKQIILDPAPASTKLSDDIWKYIDIVKPNETELQLLTNMKVADENDVYQAAKVLVDKGVKNVIVSRGKEGSILINSKGSKKYKAYEVDAIDTTAAGDSFTGALAKALASNQSLDSSIKFAHLVSSIVTTKKGAQDSIPNISELRETINLWKSNSITQIPIIIDADPGVDDAACIMLAALNPKIDLLGITTVAGNCSLKNATKNALKTLELCKINNVPVFEGASKPLDYKEVNAEFFHGSNGLGGIEYLPSERTSESESAIDYLINTVNENPGVITIVAIGPLTNIATAIKQNADFAKNIKELLIMGGSITNGNITPYAEFNFYSDALAADIVLKSNIPKIKMFGLNITEKLVLNIDRANLLKHSQSTLARFLYDITRVGDEYDKSKGFAGAVINDPVTVCYLIDNNIIKLIPAKVEIITEGEKTGKSIIHEVEKSNIEVAYDVNDEKFFENLFDRIV